MKFYQALMTVVLCLYAGVASAQTTQRAFDINLNDDVVAADFGWRLGGRQLHAGVGWLHNQDRGDVVHFAMHLVDAAASGADTLQAGLGLRLVYANPDESSLDGGAVALGGFARYVLPNANRFHIAGHLYYAPDVVSFGDVSEYYEVGARIGYNVIRDADVYLGVRSVKTDYELGDLSFDSGLHVGFQFRF